ncbi:IS110 family transposase [Microlunatus sp. Gsoil 973]|uniref:IS110 family transposase n=1 Tax=Microlunatus sp. Gsoil 973 TaxID=2672569 RepID=UPI001E3D25F8|nr:IS110 family transposase [Microlunatus sp. Gsoil 973]
MRMSRRCIGLDVHRDFAQVAIWRNGVVTQEGRFATTPEEVRRFADGLAATDEVALEATGNTWAIASLLTSRAGRVVVSNPAKTRAIAEAKIKTDKVDAAILAELLAADYLPAVWMPDAQTAALRRQVQRRGHIVRQRTRLKNQVQAILHRNLVVRCPAADLFGIKGRAWLAGQDLPPDEAAAATALLRQLDFHADELALIDRELALVALGRDDVRRLMTIPGVDATVALSIVAAVGDFTRFRTPEKLVSYLGLNPRVRQSGNQPATHGRITKSGPGYARGMLVEAAFSASKAPGPLRGFYERIRARRGIQVAIVATARKLAVLCWHLTIKGEDYAFAMPSLVAHKQRKLQLRAGLPSARGRKGASAAYSLKEVRAAERQLAERSEQAYRTMITNWRPKPATPKTPTARSGRGRQHRDTALTPSG